MINWIYYVWLCFAALRKFHNTELLFGRFRVSIHDISSIPRRIDANVTGVTLSTPSSSHVSRRLNGVLVVSFVVLLYCCIVVLLFCCFIVTDVLQPHLPSTL